MTVYPNQHITRWYLIFLYAPLGYLSRQWNSVSTISYFLSIRRYVSIAIYPDSKVHRANMGPTWVLSAPDGPHVGPMNLTTRVSSIRKMSSNHFSILVLGDPALCNAWFRRPLLPKEMFRTIHSRVLLNKNPPCRCFPECASIWFFSPVERIIKTQVHIRHSRLAAMACASKCVSK